MQGGFVDEIAVNVFAMLAQTLTVIRGHDDQRVVEPAVITQCGDQPADELVRPRHLAVVRTIRVLDGVAPRRLVRVVRIVKMNPGEKPRLPLEPSNGFFGDDIAPLLDRIQKARIVFTDFEAIRIMAEAAGETGLPRQHDG